MSMFMSHALLRFFVLSFILVCTCAYVASENQVLAFFTELCIERC